MCIRKQTELSSRHKMQCTVRIQLKQKFINDKADLETITFSKQGRFYVAVFLSAIVAEYCKEFQWNMEDNWPWSIQVQTHDLSWTHLNENKMVYVLHDCLSVDVQYVAAGSWLNFKTFFSNYCKFRGHVPTHISVPSSISVVFLLCMSKES